MILKRFIKMPCKVSSLLREPTESVSLRTDSDN
uniref:Uncharacterized protein n=1 Tax=Arundo donax TaxID=35708 RepID=A0A0A9DCD4_ARUDO